MKIHTFINYIQLNLSDKIAKEWLKGAAFEQVIQSKLDTVIRTHIANKVGVVSTADGDVTVQHSPTSKSSVGVSPPHQVRFRSPYSLPKMRENRYTYREGTAQASTISDLNASNGRLRVKNGTIVYQDTTYWIEIKVESPDTNQFGGKSLDEAWVDDLNKLQLQKAWDDGVTSTTATVKRHWLVVIAVSPEMRGRLKNGGLNDAQDVREWQTNLGPAIAVAWSDLSRTSMFGVFRV